MQVEQREPEVLVHQGYTPDALLRPARCSRESGTATGFSRLIDSTFSRTGALLGFGEITLRLGGFVPQAVQLEIVGCDECDLTVGPFDLVEHGTRCSRELICKTARTSDTLNAEAIVEDRAVQLAVLRRDVHQSSELLQHRAKLRCDVITQDIL